MTSSHSPRTFLRSSMDRLRRSLRNSFRRRGDNGTLSERHISGAGGSHPSGGDDGSKPPNWSQDEASVRAGTCSFKVKYLGSVEVYESRGMQVCEEALKVLRSNRRRPVKGVLYISGDSLRVVDKNNKGLVVDQTIEKVSFCAPDRHHEKGFAYICRDGTTRRWLCYGFHARKNTGERLSHAVGCAFAVCLEKKQKRDREAQRALTTQNQLQSIPEVPIDVSKTTDRSIEKGYNNASSFQRNSYRYASLQERLQDPQNVKPAEKPPIKPATNPHAVARPRGNKELFERQGSLRLPSDSDSVTGVAPPIKNGTADDARFRRFNSLRLNQLPSNLARFEGTSQGRGSIAEEDSSPNTPVINNKDFGHQNNPSYISPPISELSSPSSGTVTSSSPFDATKAGSINDAATTTTPQRIGSINRSRGDEWLQTTASQVKFWQQVRSVSPPAATTNSQQQQQPSAVSTSIPASDQHLPPPSFPPPPLPSTAAIATKTTSKPINQTVSVDVGRTAGGGYTNNWTTFDDKWNSLESPPINQATLSNSHPPLSPTNPFSQESAAVKI